MPASPVWIGYRGSNSQLLIQLQTALRLPLSQVPDRGEAARNSNASAAPTAHARGAATAARATHAALTTSVPVQTHRMSRQQLRDEAGGHVAPPPLRPAVVNGRPLMAPRRCVRSHAAGGAHGLTDGRHALHGGWTAEVRRRPTGVWPQKPQPGSSPPPLPPTPPSTETLYTPMKAAAVPSRRRAQADGGG